MAITAIDLGTIERKIVDRRRPLDLTTKRAKFNIGTMHHPVGNEPLYGAVTNGKEVIRMRNDLGRQVCDQQCRDTCDGTEPSKWALDQPFFLM